MTEPVLRAQGLRIDVASTDVAIVEGVDLEVIAGELVGVVGESGSGKSTLGLAFMGFTRSGLRIAAGSIRAGDLDLRSASGDALRALRKTVLGYVPQSSGFALDPARTVGAQLHERLSGVEGYRSGAARERRILEMLEEVALPAERATLKRFPHQFSGGQQQRVVIASAFLPDPRLVILDEPTTGLDVSTQARILSMVRRLCLAHDAAGIFISHDLGSVAELCDRVVVMYAGRVVEADSARGLLGGARHPYTARLIRAVPDIHGAHAVNGIPGHAPAPGQRPRGCTFAPRCPIARPRCTEEEPPLAGGENGARVRCHFPGQVSSEAARAPRPERAGAGVVDALEVVNVTARHGATEALSNVSLEVPLGTCLGLVGESGSGKTTLCRALIGLHTDYEGVFRQRGQELARRSRDRAAVQRRDIQYIFQNPYDALNPRRTIGALLEQPRRVLLGTRTPGQRSVAELLEAVSLDAGYARRYPTQLSGGELQRVAIARALASDPTVLICDEITSALDVSVQAAILELLRDLQRSMSLTLLFVTHNLPLARHIAQTTVVLHRGRVVEAGVTATVFEAPRDAYTRSLLENAPDLWSSIEQWKAELTGGGTPRP